MSKIRANVEECKRLMQAGNACLQKMEHIIAIECEKGTNAHNAMIALINQVKQDADQSSDWQELVNSLQSELKEMDDAQSQLESEMEGQHKKLSDKIQAVNQKLQRQIQLIEERIAER